MARVLCARLGLNERLVEEVEEVLSCFRRVSKSLRHACVFLVCERHSIYVGRDECPTRCQDMRRIRTCRKLGPQRERNPAKYAERYLMRLGRLDLLGEVEDAIERIQGYAPQLSMLETVTAAVLICDETSVLSELSAVSSLSERSIARVVACALELPYREIASLLRPAPTPPSEHTTQRPTVCYGTVFHSNSIVPLHVDPPHLVAASTARNPFGPIVPPPPKVPKQVALPDAAADDPGWEVLELF